MYVCRQLLTHAIAVRVLRDFGFGEGIALRITLGLSGVCVLCERVYMRVRL